MFIRTTAMFAALAGLVFAQATTRAQDWSGLTELIRLENHETQIQAALERNTAQIKVHGDNPPDVTKKNAVDAYNARADALDEERALLKVSLAAIRKHRAMLLATVDKQALPAAQAINSAINNSGWPAGVRQVLREINFDWRASAPSDFAHTIWFLNERSLVVGPALTDGNILPGNLAKAQLQLLAFEFGKLISYNAEGRSDDILSAKQSHRLWKSFQPFSGQIPHALPDVPKLEGESDRHAAFGYAYYYFVFEPSKLPKELVDLWRRDPPHDVVRDVLRRQTSRRTIPSPIP